MAIPVETFFLTPDAQGTLQAQIQQMVAEGILSGRFQRGERLPSTRALARHLGVSRITVTLSYTELQANDYLTSRGRSGYYVSDSAPEPPAFSTPQKRHETVDWSRAIGQRFSGGVTPRRPSDWARYRYPFIYGQTDPTLFDHANWRLCAIQALGVPNFRALTTDYYDQDDPELIEFIARHTLPRRGIIANPDEILVTMGAQNALWLTTQVLLNPRRTAVIETPCYPALRDILTLSRCRLAPVPVDGQGLPPDAIPQGADVIFTTPSHHCPTSVTMPLDRRRALLARARDLDALIVEDDYEFETAYLAPASPALKSLDTDGRVIYAGSFSKSLFPGLRLGYLVGSAEFIQEARALRASVLRHPPGHMQRTAAYFLRLGHYDALIKRTAKALHTRRLVIEAELAHHGLTVAGQSTHGGSSVWVKLAAGLDTAQLAETLRLRDVLIEPGQPFFVGADAPTNFCRLGYSSIQADLIPEGISRLAAALT